MLLRALRDVLRRAWHLARLLPLLASVILTAEWVRSYSASAELTIVRRDPDRGVGGGPRNPIRPGTASDSGSGADGDLPPGPNRRGGC